MIGLLAIVVILFLYVAIEVLLVAVRNYRAHQFFKKKAPGLPVIPNPRLFSGHLAIAQVKKNWRYLDGYHKDLGDTYGYYYAEQPWIATTDIELIKMIELDQVPRHLNRGQFFFPLKELNDSIVQTNDEVWRRSRRAVAPTLTNLKVCSDDVTNDIQRVIEEFRWFLERKFSDAVRKTGEKSIIIDTDDACQRLTFSVIFSVAYKINNIIDFDSTEDSWFMRFKEAISADSSPMLTLAVMFPFLRQPLHYLTYFHKIGKIKFKAVDFLRNVAKQNMISRGLNEKWKSAGLKKGQQKESIGISQMEQSNFKKRMIDVIVDNFLEKKITEKDLVGNMWGMLIAGYLTTADCINSMLWLLARHQEIQGKLRACITKEGIESEYLMWTILEAIRWHPPVALGAGRLLSEDVKLHGQVYPAGAYVVPTIRAIHHDPKIWPDPETFKPERWVDRETFHQAAFMGFGLGPRNCPGGKLAIHEIKLVMQMFLTNYQFETCSRTPESLEFSSPLFVFNRMDQPVYIKIVSIN